jgi:hypothetical protein
MEAVRSCATALTDEHFEPGPMKPFIAAWALEGAGDAEHRDPDLTGRMT